jgi:hypothetical protein
MFAFDLVRDVLREVRLCPVALLFARPFEDFFAAFFVAATLRRFAMIPLPVKP